MGTDAHVLAQPHASALDDQIRLKGTSPTASPPGAPERPTGSQDWRAGRIREWLLLLLRFAITRDAKDEAATLALADEIDALGLQWRPSAPSFFRRTSAEVCRAIAAADDPRRAAVLKKHIARIDDSRLRRAFQAAVGLEQASPPVSESKRPDLWAGLRK
ncbi:MAG TPA: hypothetical protein VH934_05730 [Xanthobacteraceae bacterium]|jgi:hypothetical protein